MKYLAESKSFSFLFSSLLVLTSFAYSRCVLMKRYIKSQTLYLTDGCKNRPSLWLLWIIHIWQKCLIKCSESNPSYYDDRDTVYLLKVYEFDWRNDCQLFFLKTSINFNRKWLIQKELFLRNSVSYGVRDSANCFWVSSKIHEVCGSNSMKSWNTLKYLINFLVKSVDVDIKSRKASIISKMRYFSDENESSYLMSRLIRSWVSNW